MSILTPKEALQKRQELVELGYTVVPGVLQNPFLDELRHWSEDIFDRVPVNPKYRYQGSDIHVSTQRKWRTPKGQTPDERQLSDPIVERIIDLPEQWEACRLLGLEGQRADDKIILLSKPPHGPPLYWHQDFTNWNHPEAASRWPTRIFLSYYLTNTTRENGCLRVIPGTHHMRIDLHDFLPAAHGEEIQAVEDLSHPAFMDHPNAVDVPVKSEDLVIADARVLHAAWPNRTGKRRTLLLQWYSVFPFPDPPTWWKGEIPDVIRKADPNVEYERTRTPGAHLS